MAEDKDPILNPLLGPSKPTVLDPLTRKPIQSPITQDPREKMHFQTTFDQTPELQNVKEDLGEYSSYGVSMFPQLQHEWDAKRAENQSSWEHLAGFVNQAVTGEVLGGTIEGIGWLGEFNHWGKVSHGEEQQVGNWFTEAGDSIKEWTKETTPIYQDPNAPKFNPGSSAW